MAYHRISGKKTIVIMNCLQEVELLGIKHFEILGPSSSCELQSGS